MQKWKQLSSTVLLDHPRLCVVEDEVQLPDGKTAAYLRFIKNPSGVSVFAVKDGKVLLEREYSYPPGKVMLQLPGGKIEGEESPEVAANRELIEEAGYSAGKIEVIGFFYGDNRRTDAKTYICLATDIASHEKVGGDVEEFIEPFWVPLSSLPKDIAGGKIDNFSILTAWAFYEARRKSVAS